MNAAPVLEVPKAAIRDFVEDDALQLAGALSFYAILSFAPLLLFIVWAVGFFWSDDALAGRLVEQLQFVVGREGAELAQTVIAKGAKPKGGAVAFVVGVGTLIFGATGVFLQLQKALNIIWEVKPRPGGGIAAFLGKRLLSLITVLGVGILLLASVAASAAITTISTYFEDRLAGSAWLWRTADLGATAMLVTLLIAFLFKYLPDAHIEWRDVVIGAIATGVLFTIGKSLIGFYLGHSSVGSAYGAAGSVVVLLVWVYYSSLILFLGAEYTQAYARWRGAAITPDQRAIQRPSTATAPG